MIVALTGGIGCGKSTVSAIFAKLGWAVLDADGICRNFYDCNDARIVEPVVLRWGSRVVDADGRINRRRVADIVFSDPAELSWLNALFHPLVQQVLCASAAKSGNEYILCDVPLLYEAGWQSGFDKVIAVWTSQQKQHERLRQRGWNENEIARREACQWSAERKLELADYGLINLYDQNALEQQCIKLDKIIKGMSWTK